MLTTVILTRGVGDPGPVLHSWMRFRTKVVDPLESSGSAAEFREAHLGAPLLQFLAHLAGKWVTLPILTFFIKIQEIHYFSFSERTLWRKITPRGNIADQHRGCIWYKGPNLEELSRVGLFLLSSRISVISHFQNGLFGKK